MELDYDDGENIVNVECPMCEGVGCSLCKFSGEIQMNNPSSVHQRQEEQNVIVPPKVVVKASDYEVDKFVTQLGRVKLSDSVAQKLYVAAYTYYKKLKEIAERVDSEDMKQKYEQVLNGIDEFNVQNTDFGQMIYLIIMDFKNINKEMFNVAEQMAVHFEDAIEVLSREFRKQHSELMLKDKELKTFKRSLLKNVEKSSVLLEDNYGRKNKGKESRSIKEVTRIEGYNGEDEGLDSNKESLGL